MTRFWSNATTFQWSFTYETIQFLYEERRKESGTRLRGQERILKVRCRNLSLWSFCKSTSFLKFSTTCFSRFKMIIMKVLMRKMKNDFDSWFTTVHSKRTVTFFFIYFLFLTIIFIVYLLRIDILFIFFDCYWCSLYHTDMTSLFYYFIKKQSFQCSKILELYRCFYTLLLISWQKRIRHICTPDCYRIICVINI